MLSKKEAESQQKDRADTVRYCEAAPNILQKSKQSSAKLIKFLQNKLFIREKRSEML